MLCLYILIIICITVQYVAAVTAHLRQWTEVFHQVPVPLSAPPAGVGQRRCILELIEALGTDTASATHRGYFG